MKASPKWCASRESVTPTPACVSVYFRIPLDNCSGSVDHSPLPPLEPDAAARRASNPLNVFWSMPGQRAIVTSSNGAELQPAPLWATGQRMAALAFETTWRKQALHVKWAVGTAVHSMPSLSCRNS